MENGVAAFTRQDVMKLIQILHGLVDSLGKLSMPAVAKLVDRLSRLGFKGEPVPFAQIDKPAMERPATIGIRIIVPLLVKRTGRLNVPCPCNAHEFFASRFRISSVLQHMRGINIVKRLVFERE